MKHPAMLARQRAFTLVEVLIAVLVFGVLAASAYVALDGLSRAALSQRAHADELAKLQMAVARLDADLRQLTTRSIRIEGGREPALLGEAGRLVATRAGWANPSGLGRSHLQRFAWQVEDGQLSRLHWPVTDPAPGTQPMFDPVLAGISDWQFRYRDGTGGWHERWPLDAGQLEALPSAIEVSFVTESFGPIRRLLVLTP
jgi:general secretion pathway protein J